MQKKRNGIFFVKLISAVVLVSLIIGIANYYYKKDYYYMDVYGEVDAMKDVPYGLTMVNFGTSHGLSAFRYPEDTNGEVCYNLALSGEDIYHDFQTLKQFTDHLAEGCIVALPTSYFSFCMSTESPSQKRYYLYLDKEYIRGFNYETLINAKYLPVLRSGEFIIKNLINDQDIDLGGAMMNNEDNSEESTNGLLTVSAKAYEEQSENIDALNKKDEELTYHAKGRVVSWRNGYMITGKKYMTENIKLLVDMVEYCYDHGFKPVLVTTPIYKALNNEFPDEELKECYFDNIDKVVKQTKVPYMNLSHDIILSENPYYFGNSDHMSEEGADAFYKEYLSFLKSIGYLRGK